jgi:hypothetical protein
LTADRIRCAAQQAFASPADWRDGWIYFLMASFPAFNSSFPIITAYGIQDFLRANPFFADVQANADQELRALVDTAHAAGLYVIFDIILNHTANVFGYAPMATAVSLTVSDCVNSNLRWILVAGGKREV